MPRNDITITPAEYRAAISQRRDGELRVRVNDLYNRVVAAINATEDSIELADTDLDILPMVHDLLGQKGFGAGRLSDKIHIFALRREEDSAQ